MLCIVLAILLGNSCVQAQKKNNEVQVNEKSSDEVAASVNCNSLGAINGIVTYQYDATLKNNTSDKLIVKYNIIFKAGDVIKKQHSHSTLLIPDEKLTESYEDTMNESDWNLVTRCWIEWTATKQ